MVVFGSTELEFQRFGRTAHVPDADIAKVMYYLDCVCTVIEYDDNNIRRYRNYSNWRNMSDEEDRFIFLLALTLSPNELEDKVFFNIPDVCPDTNNAFYEIGQVKRQLMVVQSIIIDG
ncbi:unnamed protein product [Rotaria sp. Silwood1]|nr:unnamed protein product [Rotaria sp. Silwood1]